MENLKQLLLNLRNAGINTVDFKMIEWQINTPVIDSVLIILNQRFRVYFDKEKGSIQFETVENQKVTDLYINELLEIKEYLPMIEQTIRDILIVEVS